MINKILSLKWNLLIPIVAFFSPIKPLILLVGFMILLDTFFGLYRAKKTNEAITSRKLSQIASKMFLYQGSVILFFLIETYILKDFIKLISGIDLFITKIIAIFLVLIEMISINENYSVVKGTSIFRTIKDVITRVKEVKEDVKDIYK
jgi:hypothetical protein